MNVAAGKQNVRIRVLIADDQPRARHSLEALLTAMRWRTPGGTDGLPYLRPYPPIEIVGEAGDGQQTVAQVQALHPDVVLMDLHLRTVPFPEPSLDGAATIRIIKSRWPLVRIVVLTMYATDRASTLTAGADAFLLKGCPTSELLEAVMPDLRQEETSR